MIYLLIGSLILFLALALRTESVSRRLGGLVENLRDGEVDATASRKALSVRVTDLEPEPLPLLGYSPDSVPTFVSGPSCAFCKVAIDKDELYVTVDAVLPMIGGGELPISMIIHDYHTEIIPPIREGDISL
jgi:hypothetical protein